MGNCLRYFRTLSERQACKKINCYGNQDIRRSGFDKSEGLTFTDKELWEEEMLNYGKTLNIDTTEAASQLTQFCDIPDFVL